MKVLGEQGIVKCGEMSVEILEEGYDSLGRRQGIRRPCLNRKPVITSTCSINQITNPIHSPNEKRIFEAAPASFG